MLASMLDNGFVKKILDIFVIYFFVILLINEIQCIEQGCFTWKEDKQDVHLTCTIYNLEHEVSIVSPTGLHRGQCKQPFSVPSCNARNGRITQNLVTNQTVFIIRNTYPGLDGVWKCNHGFIVIPTTVLLSKGIMSGVQLNLTGKLFSKIGRLNTFELTCSSCWKPDNNNVEYFVNGITTDSMRLINSTCYHKEKKCKSSVCRCTEEPNVYQWRFSTTTVVELEPLNFSCSMRFTDSKMKYEFITSAFLQFNEKGFEEKEQKNVKLIHIVEYSDSETEKVDSDVEGYAYIWIPVGAVLVFIIGIVALLTFCRYSKNKYQGFEVKEQKNVKLSLIEEYSDSETEKVDSDFEGFEVKEQKNVKLSLIEEYSDSETEKVDSDFEGFEEKEQKNVKLSHIVEYSDSETEKVDSDFEGFEEKEQKNVKLSHIVEYSNSETEKVDSDFEDLKKRQKNVKLSHIVEYSDSETEKVDSDFEVRRKRSKPSLQNEPDELLPKALDTTAKIPPSCCTCEDITTYAFCQTCKKYFCETCSNDHRKKKSQDKLVQILNMPANKDCLCDRCAKRTPENICISCNKLYCKTCMICVCDHYQSVSNSRSVKPIMIHRDKDLKQDLPGYNPSPLQLTEHDEIIIPFDMKPTRIRGIACIDENRFVIADYNNCSLKVFKDSKLSCTISLKHEPRGMVAVQNSTVAVTHPNERKIQFIDVDNNSNKTKNDSLSFEDKPFSIAYHSEHFVVEFNERNDGYIAVLSMKGDFQFKTSTNENFAFFTGHTIRLALDTESKSIYVSALGKQEVTCIKYEDSKIDWKIKAPSPRGVIVLPGKKEEKDKTIILASRKCNTIYHLNPDTGRKYIMMDMDSNNNIDSPRYLTYYQSNSDFFLVVEVKDTIKIYRVSERNDEYNTTNL